MGRFKTINSITWFLRIGKIKWYENAVFEENVTESVAEDIQAESSENTDENTVVEETEEALVEE